MCHVSQVMCHMSPVNCHVYLSGVTCLIFFLQSGEARYWKVCYQQGIPRLVFLCWTVINGYKKGQRLIHA